MDDPVWTIDATLTAKGFELVRPPLVYRGPLQVHGKRAVVELEIPDTTFVQLPTVKLIDHSELPIDELAHVLDGNNICYHGSTGLPLNLYDPGGAALRVLEDAARAMERSFAGGAKAEFEMELPSYWRGNIVWFDLPIQSESTISPADMIPQTGEEDGGLVIVPKGAWEDRRPRYRFPVIVLSFDRDIKRGTKLPLNSLAEAIGFVAAQESPPVGWREAILSATAAGEDVFLSAPNAIVGWRAELPPLLRVVKDRGKGSFRPGFFRGAVERAINNIGLHRMTGKQVDLSFCVERNLSGAPSLIGKRISLVGCGMIGGYLARMLVQCGAGCGANLTLYDMDTLSAGNLGRHLLGFDDLGKNKAAALATHLRTFHPDVQAVARPVDATKEWAELERSDLILDATGEPNVATAINDLYLTSGRAGGDLALLHAFVFGNGVAAQSFLNLKDGLACYCCLQMGFGGQWRHNPLKDTSSPLRQVAAGCGEGDYFPFAVDAPVAAAGLALRAVLDWAGGQPGRRLRTIIVDHAAGREKVPWASPEALPECRACGR